MKAAAMPITIGLDIMGVPKLGTFALRRTREVDYASELDLRQPYQRTAAAVQQRLPIREHPMVTSESNMDNQRASSRARFAVSVSKIARPAKVKT